MRMKAGLFILFCWIGNIIFPASWMEEHGFDIAKLVLIRMLLGKFPQVSVISANYAGASIITS